MQTVLLAQRQITSYVDNLEYGYFFRSFCNAVWYITNHDIINDAARTNNVQPVPRTFSSDKFENKYDIKEKKVKAVHLIAGELVSHSQALFSLVLKPVVKSSPAWCEAHTIIKKI